jgi:hypothetical protein
VGEGVNKGVANLRDCVQWYIPSQYEDGCLEELDQLEAKVQELDRREFGVVTLVSYDGFTCSKCDAMEEYKFNYCPNCGHRLI